MKILHVLYESREDAFGHGGVAVRAYEIYKHLRDRHNITLLCKKYVNAGNREIEGLRHVFVGTETRSLIKTFFSYAYRSTRFVKQFGHEFDLIIEEFSPAIPLFLHAFTKKPLILQVQGYTGRHYFRKYNPLTSLVLYTMERIRPVFYRNFIFMNDVTRGKYLLRRSAQVGFIPNGISSDFLHLVPSEGDYILYVGRIDIYSKGLDTLIEAYKEFYREFPRIALQIAGNGQELENLKKILRKLPKDIADNIHLLGWISGREKLEIMRNAMFCIFTSRHEVQSISAMEAMACQKSVVVSNIPQFRYITERGAGKSFRRGDASSLSRVMKEVAGMSPDERTAMGEEGRQHMKDFTWDAMALRYENFLYEVLGSKGNS
jgi:glycosyltransferase involved in cell wall biosynthesis